MPLTRFSQFAFLLAGLAAGAAAQAQAPDPGVWTEFAVRVKDDYRYGYRDARGRIRLPARFGGLTNTLRFRHIMAVMEGDTGRAYYVLKNGRQVGQDSVFVFDMLFDCESEGAIRFRDRQKNRVGFFNAQGKVLIPALYNHVSAFHNGVAVALIGARLSCPHGDADTTTCEHSAWVGGRQLLINQHNKVLADLPATFPNGRHLNWYSLQRNAPAPDTATTVTLAGPDGTRYTFRDYDREFERWFYGTFVPAVRSRQPQALQALCFSELAVASRPFKGWPQLKRAAFVARYRPLLRARLGGLRRGAPGVALVADDLIRFTFTGHAFDQFMTDCNWPFEEKYPAFDVLLTFPAQATSKTFDHQEHFEFIRTAAGYRLFSVSL